MSSLLKAPVQFLFWLTSKKRALAQARGMLAEYESLVREAGVVAAESQTVPRMMGVDEDMRDWSLFQLLEHNTIVNRAITQVICHLAAGRDPADAPRFDPKRDVMPSAEAGEEQVEAFADSVRDFCEKVAGLSDLRKTARIPHPMFGNFTAHHWVCMLPLHLKVHRRQAWLLARMVRS
jgi:hypothetical protein